VRADGNARCIEFRSVARRAELQTTDDAVVVSTLAVGICGTDREILQGQYGVPVPGRQHLILGHEALGEVLQAPAGSSFKRGDLVVGIVRHPDPEPCRACALGEWDMCRNGRYTEHGTKERDGFCVEQFTIEPGFLHYDQAADALTQASPEWLRGLISRRIPLSEWRSAIRPQPGDIKVVIDFAL
jgi:threonine dehydrogenase-like Zn-dependent dehydrogenase